MSLQQSLQWQPHEPPQHPPPLNGSALAPSDDLPFAGAANTDNCTVFLALSHFGQVTTVLLFMTIRS